MKLAVVVQRYGADINGGAELHARYIAERLSRHASVEVVTTCARDYVTWKNELPAGTEKVNGISVRRFPVSHERNRDDFGRRSHRVFEKVHSIADELGWLESEGPASPELVNYVEKAAKDLDFVVLFSYRYYHSWHLARRLPEKAVLVPTAERDATIGLSIFGPIFRGVRALMYNSPEERAMIQAASGNTSVPGVVVGVGSDVPDRVDPERFRRKFKMRPAIRDLHRPHRREQGVRRAVLALPALRHGLSARHGPGADRQRGDEGAEAPAHSSPRFSRRSRQVRRARRVGSADHAVVFREPVDGGARGMGARQARCWPTRSATCSRDSACGATRASIYENYEEFVEALYSLESNGPAERRLGRNGKDFFKRHYAWPVIEKKYLDMFEQFETGSGPRRR